MLYCDQMRIARFSVGTPKTIPQLLGNNHFQLLGNTHRSPNYAKDDHTSRHPLKSTIEICLLIELWVSYVDSKARAPFLGDFILKHYNILRY